MLPGDGKFMAWPTLSKKGTVPMNLDEARQLANVNERAQRLFEDGYRIRSLDGNLHLIRKQHGATYTLDRAESRQVEALSDKELLESQDVLA
jgi:hypothetical protein